MAGHSKWAKIKRQKGANDAARGKVFAKLSKEITLAAQEGGGDPDMNFVLRMAIDKAKAANFPADNIERAIKKGTGELKDGEKIVELIYEAYGPAGVGVLIRAQTDNTNRALTDIRTIVEKDSNGKMAAEGSVSWQFEEKGIIVLESSKFVESEKYGKEGAYVDTDADEMMLELMEIPGIEDIVKLGEEDGLTTFEVVSERDSFSNVAQSISAKQFKVIESGLGYKPNQTIELSSVDQQSLDDLIERLDDCEEVDEVWDNSA